MCACVRAYARACTRLYAKRIFFFFPLHSMRGRSEWHVISIIYTPSAITLPCNYVERMIHAQLSSTESISQPFRLGRVTYGESIASSKQKFARYQENCRRYPLEDDKCRLNWRHQRYKSRKREGEERKRSGEKERDEESHISRQFSELQVWRHRLDIIRFNSLNFAKIANLPHCVTV